MEHSIKRTISNIEELKTIIENNEGLVIINFRASWCNPCKVVSPMIDDYLNNPPKNGIVHSYIIDIDECFQIYMQLKKLRILTGVPSLICYTKGVFDFYPVDSVFGSNTQQIIEFFERCKVRLEQQ